ncbi:unnamed protein product [Ophioblennius macclurei]
MLKLASLSSSREAFRGLSAIVPRKTPVSFVAIGVTACFIMLQLSPCQSRGQHGTTPHIKHIAIGRCYTYKTLVNPALRYDCEEIWRRFEEAVIHPATCNVSVQDYHPMFNLMPQIWPCNKFLFWSKTRSLMHSYAAVLGQFWTLEDTLPGYMFNDLIWCGLDKESGFDHSSCPEWSACERHPVYSLWKKASQNFAEMACGNITVLLNGSVVNAFSRRSMFGSVELDSLNPERVDHVNIKVVTNLEGPHIESCHKGSIVNLIHILQFRGFRWTCTDADQILTNLQCIQDQKRSSSQTCASSLNIHNKSLTPS